MNFDAIPHEQRVAIAKRQARLVVDEMAGQNKSTADAIARALAYAMFACADVETLRARCAELETRLAPIEPKAQS